MDENEQEYGDEKFKEYMENFQNNNKEDDSLELILKNIRFKITSILKLYSKSIETYIKIKDSDPFKEKLREFLIQLTKLLMINLPL